MINLYLFFTGLIFSCAVFAQYSAKDIEKFRNDKEVVISLISKREIKRIKKNFSDQETIRNYSRLFSRVMLNYLNSDERNCDLRLIEELSKGVVKNTPANLDQFKDFLKVLRINHHIDDIFYEILMNNASIYYGMQSLKLDKKARVSEKAADDLLETNDIEKMFSTFKEFPDDRSSCVLSEYIFIFDNIKDKDYERANSEKNFKKLLQAALAKSLISLSTYRKLEYLVKETKVHEREIWLNDYFNIIFKAKNRMLPIKSSFEMVDIEKEDDFASERIRRFSKITRRKLLYRKYNETQIILLSQVLQKASRRMGSDPDTITGIPTISQEFSVLTPSGERETYVEVLELDPQSQYNLARRLLRKDMTELQMMDVFVKQKITHEDIVMAGLETGYISLTELEFVVQYDDLWNPEISKFERLTGFIFKVAGYGSFFLPPPWNITATIALGIVEGVVNNKNRTGVDNDNPATFIE